MAVRLDLLLGLKLGGSGVVVVFIEEMGIWLLDGDGDGDSADGLSRCSGGMTGSDGRLDLLANSFAKKPIRGDEPLFCGDVGCARKGGT